MQIHNTFLFASELDGVLLPNGTFTAKAGCLDRTRELLERLKSANYPVIYVASHHLSLAREGRETFGLPEPNYWICNLGSEIYDAFGNADDGWERMMGPPFPKETLLNALKENPELTVQEEENQGAHKLSLYYPEPVDDNLRAWISMRVGQIVEGTRLTDYPDRLSGMTSLDIIPANAGKASALGFLTERLGLPRTQVFFSGDSEDDLDALMSGICGTLVGSASGSVQEKARKLAENMEGARLTLSRGYYGDGVIEGLRVYDFLH
uniref:HAD-superfamily hydrolase, subfamily IIB n=1 Tax=Candidatus Kentrum sp. TC TaxID=2126339 RepID=A0A450YW00_9GAMM|nr:MAG: HAD-superfamily hydrolase, subfamily IIB [Candidatus Kentron sp. TC]